MAPVLLPTKYRKPDSRFHFFGLRAQRQEPEPEVTPEVQADMDRKTKLLRTARKQFRNIAEYEYEMRAEMLEDFNFTAGKQWAVDVENQRSQTNRPLITSNRLPQFKKQIVNEIRQNRASIQINPSGGSATIDTAEVIQGLTRHVEIKSHADVAYDTGSDHQVTCGRGWVRVLTQTVPGTFDEQEIVIKRIPNPFAVYMDTACQEIDYSDARYGFIVEDLDRDAFEQQFPNSTFGPSGDFDGVGQQNDWYPDQRVRVAEYFYVTYEDGILQKLDDDSTVWSDEELPEGRHVVDEIPQQRKRVKWAKITGREVLDERDWPGDCIPIVPILGDEILLNNKRQYVGITRFARQPQQMLNYILTSGVEAVSLAPKALWLAAEGQIENYEKFYKQCNTRNIAVLYYKLMDASGRPAAPPQRISTAVDLQHLALLVAQFEHALQSSIGIYNPTLGDVGPEQSGRAILARQRQGNTATFNFGDNQARAIAQVGRICLNLIQKHIYPEATVEHIVSPDGTRRPVPLNQPFINDGKGGFVLVSDDQVIPENAIQKIYDVRTGRYMVDVTVGPSYQSRRQEAAESMLTLVQHFPQIMQLAGDLLVGDMDWPQAREIAARLKKTLPPALQQEDGGQPQIDPQQAAAAIQQLQATIAGLSQLLKGKALEIDAKERIAAADRASKEKISAINAKAGIVEAALKAGSAEAQSLADNDYAATEHILELADRAEQRQQDLIEAQRQAAQGGGANPQAQAPAGQATPPQPPQGPSPLPQ